MVRAYPGRLKAMPTRVAVLTAAATMAAATTATAGIFGPEPTAVSTRGANGPSGSPAISGDNRTARYVAFNSFATRLVPHDTNGASDVFVYNRFTRQLVRASVGPHGAQANGASANPALDGSVQRSPRCVAFQSQATNLSGLDHDRHWDIYVRDLEAHTTRLVSRGVRGSAVDPAISGDCRKVAFTAAGRIYVGNGLRGGRPHYLARGTNPSVARDGSAITWERGHGVWLERLGHKVRVAKIGGNPHVSDAGSSRNWAVVYDSPTDVYMKVFRSSGRAFKTLLVSGHGGHSLGGISHNGGVTAYGWPRGIVVFENTRGGESTLWYMNLHSGNIDDLAHAPAPGDEPAFRDIATSARANYAVFSSTASFPGDSNGGTQDVFLKFLGGK